MNDNRHAVRVGISCGDLNGVGIEVVLKCFEDPRMLADITPVLYCSGKVVSQHRKLLPRDVVVGRDIKDKAAGVVDRLGPGDIQRRTGADRRRIVGLGDATRTVRIFVRIQVVARLRIRQKRVRSGVSDLAQH